MEDNKEQKIKLYCFQYDPKENGVYRQEFDAKDYKGDYFIHDKDDETIYINGRDIDTIGIAQTDKNEVIYVYTKRDDVNYALDIINKAVKKEFDYYKTLYNKVSDKLVEIKNKYPTGRKMAAIPCGYNNVFGEKNSYYFYTGMEYDYNSVENIIIFAKEMFPNLKELSDDEIKNNHIYWATDSSNYKGMYNGDTYILFNDLNKLPEDERTDAIKYCPGLSEENEISLD